MRVLLSTIGSRGDVQPLVGLGLRLKAHGASVRICAPPDFETWVKGFGFDFTPVGISVRSTAKAPARTSPPTPEEMLAIAKATVTSQFEALSKAADGYDVLAGANALQIALRTVAEQQGSRYVFVSYCPMTLPSPRHSPPSWRGDAPGTNADDNTKLWAADAQRWNASWGAALNEHCSALGLPLVEDVRSHIFTDRPWLAADATLGPWHDPDTAFQTGAWILPDERPLSPELDRFLDAGDPPIYVGFGSVRAPEAITDKMIAAARALGRRVLILRGWADLAAPEAPDVVSIEEVNQQALFRRVAVAAHHGGAGTTTAAALSAAPQLIMPQHYDQPYWAKRISELGVGAGLSGSPTIEALAATLEKALSPPTNAAAQLLAGMIRRDGAERAAKAIVG